MTSHETQRAGAGSYPGRQTWRVRGVPTDFDKEKLTDVLRYHLDLQGPSGDTRDNVGGVNNGSNGNGVWVHTLAPDLRPGQAATVRFRNLPARLRALERSDQLTIDVHTSPESTHVGVSREPAALLTTRLTIDQHFNGLTVLFAPSTGEHYIDVLAVSGLGSHPFGSFIHKGDGHMWLSDSLPRDMPAARVMTYGYESGLQDSTSFAHLDDLASSLHLAMCRLLRSGEQSHLILVGHSLGGLLIKEALTRMMESDSEADLTRRIFGGLFFGVPNDGMDIESLIPMVNGQPNRSLLESLSAMNSQILRLQSRNFAKVLSQTAFELSCFYETRLSPTAAQDSAGRWKMEGPRRCLVSPASATSCLPSGVSSDHSAELPRTHSELVKFASHDSEYDKVSYVLGRMYHRIKASSTPGVSPSKLHYAVPLETVHTYVQRAELSKKLEQKLRIRYEKASVLHAVALHGLGGAGKSQLALNYAEKHKDRYNPILWIDATDEEAVRSSFKRCATELGLPEECVERQESVLVDAGVQAVLRWLRDRTEVEGEWLVIVDNADDVSWGLQKIMPKGKWGSIIVTSRDDRSIMLVSGAREQVHVGVMSPPQGATLLLRHLQLDAQLASEGVRHSCDEVARKLEYLALAIDLAGAYIGNDPAPGQALPRYLIDYDRHRDELLQMDDFRGLLPTQKTVWTVWDTTLEKITKEHARLQPELMLTFLAHFKGSIIQDEMFRLASLGIAAVDAKLDDKVGEGIPAELRQFFALDGGEWDSFRYRRGRDVLARYSLLQRTGGEWGGVTMHSLVQWRATQSDQSRPWQWWYMVFVLAACLRITEEQHQPEFRRHLMVHLPDMWEVYGNSGKAAERHEDFVGTTLGRVYYDEGRWQEAEKLFVQVMETRKTKLGADHPDTLTSMANLASTYRNQGRWEEAENLFVQVMETSKTKLGANYPDTLTSMANLASTYRNQGRWEEAEKLFMQVMETSKMKLGADHPNTLTSMANLASTYRNQGRWEEAEKLFMQVMETSKMKLGADHPNTLTSMANLASTYRNQGRWEEAEKLFVQVIETRKTKLGADHPDTLTSMANLASTYRNQGRWEEAEKLSVQVIETRKTKLGADHPDTLTSMANLASTYRNQGRWEEAEKLEVQVIETRKTKLGADHPDTLTSMANLASTYRNQGRWEEAEKLEVQVMETSKTKLGADHPDTLMTMNNLAFTWKGQGRYAKALALMKDCAQARQRVLGPKHPSTLSSFAAIAQWSS